MRYTDYYSSRQAISGFAGLLIGTQREAEVLVQVLLLSRKSSMPDFVLPHK